jgi:hypothetical protein
VGDVEGGLGPNHLWSRNPPQVAMYPSENTMVPIAGPLRKINTLAFYVPARKHDRRYDEDL